MWKYLGVDEEIRNHLFTLMKKEMKVTNNKLAKRYYMCKPSVIFISTRTLQIW